MTLGSGLGKLFSIGNASCNNFIFCHVATTIDGDLLSTGIINKDMANKHTIILMPLTNILMTCFAKGVGSLEGSIIITLIAFDEKPLMQVE